MQQSRNAFGKMPGEVALAKQLTKQLFSTRPPNTTAASLEVLRQDSFLLCLWSTKDTPPPASCISTELKRSDYIIYQRYICAVSLVVFAGSNYLRKELSNRSRRKIEQQYRSTFKTRPIFASSRKFYTQTQGYSGTLTQ